MEGATSDIAFVARGPELGDVYAAAAEAVLAATVEVPDAVRDVERRGVSLEEPDLELLLLRFLNRLVYLRDAEDLLLRPLRVEVVQGDSARLGGELAGERLDPPRHRPVGEVKAATAHGLRVARVDKGWEAHFTLDV